MHTFTCSCRFFYRRSKCCIRCFAVVICFFANRTLRGDVSNDKFFGCSLTIFSGEPFSLYPFNILLSLDLYSSLVSRCFVRVMCPIHLFIQSKAISPSIHPITRVLVVRVGLASRRHLQVVGVVLPYRVGKVITCSTLWLYVVGDIHGLL
jgi:hypothetical protein